MNSSFSVEDDDGSSVTSVYDEDDFEDDLDGKVEEGASSLSSSSSVVLVLRDEGGGVGVEEDSEEGEKTSDDQFVPFVVGSVPVYLAAGDDGKPVYIRQKSDGSGRHQNLSFGGFSDNSDSTFEGFGSNPEGMFEGFVEDEESCDSDESQFDGFSDESQEIEGGKQKIEFIRKWQRTSQCYNNLDIDCVLEDSDDELPIGLDQPSTSKVRPSRPTGSKKKKVSQSPKDVVGLSCATKRKRVSMAIGHPQEGKERSMDSKAALIRNATFEGKEKQKRGLPVGLISPKGNKNSSVKEISEMVDISSKSDEIGVKDEIEFKEEEVDNNDSIGVHCNQIGCTISWLESMASKLVTVTNGIVFELDEFAKKINWERIHVAKWILRLRGILNIEPTEEDLSKIHMILKRRKALTVTLAGRKNAFLKLEEFDTTEFTLPSDIKTEIEEVIIPQAENLINVTRVNASSNQSGTVASGVAHRPSSANKNETMGNISSCQPTQKPLRKSRAGTFKVGEIRFRRRDQNSDTPVKGKNDPSAYRQSLPCATETRRASEELPRSPHTMGNIKKRKSSDDSELIQSKLSLGSKMKIGNTGQLGEMMSMSGNAIKKFKRSDDSRVTFYCRDNHVYPFFTETNEAQGKYCKAAGLTIDDLNEWTEKDIDVTQGLVIELYNFYRSRGCTVTALAQRLLQLKKDSSVAMHKDHKAINQSLVSMVVKITGLLKKGKKDDDFNNAEFLYPQPSKRNDKFQAPGWECKVKQKRPEERSEKQESRPLSNERMDACNSIAKTSANVDADKQTGVLNGPSPRKVQRKSSCLSIEEEDHEEKTINKGKCEGGSPANSTEKTDANKRKENSDDHTGIGKSIGLKTVENLPMQNLDKESKTRNNSKSPIKSATIEMEPEEEINRKTEKLHIEKEMESREVGIDRVHSLKRVSETDVESTAKNMDNQSQKEKQSDCKELSVKTNLVGKSQDGSESKDKLDIEMNEDEDKDNYKPQIGKAESLASSDHNSDNHSDGNEQGDMGLSGESDDEVVDIKSGISKAVGGEEKSAYQDKGMQRMGQNAVKSVQSESIDEELDILRRKDDLHSNFDKKLENNENKDDGNYGTGKITETNKKIQVETKCDDTSTQITKENFEDTQKEEIESDDSSAASKSVQRDIPTLKVKVSHGICKGKLAGSPDVNAVEVRRGDRERTLSARVRDFHSVSNFFEDDKALIRSIPKIPNSPCPPKIPNSPCPDSGKENKPQSSFKKGLLQGLGRDCNGAKRQYKTDDPRVSFTLIDGRIIPYFKDASEVYLGKYCEAVGLTVEDLNSSEAIDVFLTKGVIVELVNFYRSRACTMTSLADRLLKMKKIYLESILNLVARFVPTVKHAGNPKKMGEEFLFPPGQHNVVKRTPSRKNPKTKNNVGGLPTLNSAFPTQKKKKKKKSSSKGASSTYTCEVVFTDESAPTTKKKKKKKTKDNQDDSVTVASTSTKGSEKLGDENTVTQQKISKLGDENKKTHQKTSKVAPSKMSEQFIVDKEIEKARGKMGSVTRADIVLLYAKWLKNKTKVGSLVFVTDLLHDVVQLMDERKVQTIRIPAGTLMSSSVKLYEEYRRMWTTNKADAMMYLEEDWLEDIQYLVSITQTSRRNTTEMSDGDGNGPNADENKPTPMLTQEIPVPLPDISGDFSDSSSERSLRIDESFLSDNADMSDFCDNKVSNVKRKNESKPKGKLASRNRKRKSINKTKAISPAAQAVCEIEKIVDYKCKLDEKAKKQISYLVRWKGCEAEEDTWVSEEELQCSKALEKCRRQSAPSKLSDVVLKWQPLLPRQKLEHAEKLKSIDSSKNNLSSVDASIAAKCSLSDEVNDKENSPHNLSNAKAKNEEGGMTNGDLLYLYDSWRHETQNLPASRKPFSINVKVFTEKVEKSMTLFGLKPIYSDVLLQTCFILTLIRKMLSSEEALSEFLGKDCMPALESSRATQENNPNNNSSSKIKKFSADFVKLKTEFTRAKKTRSANRLRVGVTEDEVERLERSLDRAQGQPQFLGGALRQEIGRLGKSLLKLKDGSGLAREFRMENPEKYEKACSDILECGVPEKNVENIMDSVLNVIGRLSDDIQEDRVK